MFNKIFSKSSPASAMDGYRVVTEGYQVTQREAVHSPSTPPKLPTGGSSAIRPGSVFNRATPPEQTTKYTDEEIVLMTV